MSEKAKKPRFDPFMTCRARNASVVSCSCGGVTYDVTVPMAEFIGVKHYRCAKCLATYAARIMR